MDGVWCRVHAASVLHMAHMLLDCPEGLKEVGFVDQEGHLEAAMLMAAICHDYQHPGLNNDFLIKSHDPLALSYNDKSPLENHHASAASCIIYKHLRTPEYQVSATIEAAPTLHGFNARYMMAAFRALWAGAEKSGCLPLLSNAHLKLSDHQLGVRQH